LKVIKEKSSIYSLVLMSIFSRLFLLFISWLSIAIQSSEGQYAIQAFSLSNLLYQFSQADFIWYGSVALNGYEHRAFSDDIQANWAFYPLWPLVLKLITFWPQHIFTFGLVICNLCFLIAIIFLYKLIKLDFSHSVAYSAVLLLILSPFSYYFFRPGPESLFLLLVVLSFYFSKKINWFLAGLCAALATLTRLQGILLFLPLAYIYYRQYKQTFKHNYNVLWLLLVPAALLGFMTYLYFLTGNFFASFHIQRSWNNLPSYPFCAVINYFKAPVLSIDSWDLSALTIISIFVSLALTIWMGFQAVKRKFPLEYFLFSLLNIYVNVSRTNLMAGSRYTLVIFPLFIALAIVSQKTTLFQLLLFCFSSLLTFLFMQAVTGHNWALV
jgi:Gpi18-like mannosyltransferase